MDTPISILCFQNLKKSQEKLITDIAPNIKITTVDRSEPLENIKFPNDVNIVLAWGQQCIDPLLSQMPNLQWIQTFSAGVDQILTPEVIKRNIPVSNSKGIHGVPISEYVFANLLSHYRRLPEMQEQQINKNWNRIIGDEIFDKTIGIIGLGAIGREIAKRAKAFGLEVLANKRHRTEELFIDRLYTDDELDEMLPQCDIVVLALPLTPLTHHFFNSDKFNLMKKTACLVNISRGDVVIEKDLIDALKDGVINHAILDVFEEEPLPSISPLWDLPSVTLTPHVSAFTPYYMDRALNLFAENLKRFIQKKSLSNVIDPDIGY